jgi:hypothetical protein
MRHVPAGIDSLAFSGGGSGGRLQRPAAGPSQFLYEAGLIEPGNQRPL